MTATDLASLARDACIHDPRLLWGLLVGNFLVFLAYCLIPLGIYRVLRRLVVVPLKRLLWLFVGFILSCGGTHLCAVLVLFWPWYWWELWIVAVTAGISLWTAALLNRSARAIATEVNDAMRLIGRVQDAAASRSLVGL